jgi:hypothetical protein
LRHEATSTIADSPITAVSKGFLREVLLDRHNPALPSGGQNFDIWLYHLANPWMEDQFK